MNTGMGGIAGIAEEKKLGQGVMSIIVFPLGQDEVAVSKAINSLLQEKWEFLELTLTDIKVRRVWEA